MKSRIRIGILLFKDDRLLLIRHVSPDNGYEWWVCPGGGIKDNESIFDAAVREAKEECNLSIKPGKPVYVRQYISDEFKQNNLDVYLTGDIISGEETIANLKEIGSNDSRYIKEYRYFSEDEIKSINLFPKILQHEMWDDKRKGFNNLKFIGVQYDKE
jgi:8-oxo-dGTP diphosphatase